MALPLPNVISNVGPGGPLVTAMGGMNAYNNALQEARMNAVKAQYAPLTVQSEAASKLAYANLMGPQFLAKLMGNPDVVANSQQLQDPETMKRLYQAGMGAGTGNAMMNMPGMGQQQDNMSPLHNIINSIRSAFGFGVPQQQQSGQQPMNAMLQNNPMLSQQDRIALSNQQPGQSYQVQGNPGPGDNSGYAYDKNGRNIKASPQEVSEIANNGNQRPRTYAENAGNYAGIKAEGQELGKARAVDIADIGKQQQALSESGVILDRLIKTTQDPEFQKMRDKIPYFQDKQLWYLSKNGTPQQQKMIGDLISTAQAFKASTVNSFKGKALEKEFNLADKIKIDENDTMGVIQGKLASLKTLKDIAETKNDKILELMSDGHMNLGKAIRTAGKMVDTSSIEKHVDNLLSPQPTNDDIEYMMKKRNLSREQIVKQLKERGYKNVS